MREILQYRKTTDIFDRTFSRNDIHQIIATAELIKSLKSNQNYEFSSNSRSGSNNTTRHRSSTSKKNAITLAA